MFIKSIKISKKETHLQTFFNDKNDKKSTYQNRQTLYQNIQTLPNTINKQSIRLKFDNFKEFNTFDSPLRKTKIINFQNQYLRSLTNMQPIVDFRKQTIKDKIKLKVKEQLDDLLKRNNFKHKSMSQMKRKDLLSQSRVNVSVQGSSIYSMKSPITYSKQSIQKINTPKSGNRRISLPQTIKKPKTADTFHFPLQSKRPYSNSTRIYQTKRSVHSALSQLRLSVKKQQLIEPWQDNQQQ